MYPQAREDFGNVNRAAGQDVSFVYELLQKPAPITFAIDGINDDARVEQERGHVNGRSLFESASHPGGEAWPPTWLRPASIPNDPYLSRNQWPLPRL